LGEIAEASSMPAKMMIIVNVGLSEGSGGLLWVLA
jgi:hypothetical protein